MPRDCADVLMISYTSGEMRIVRDLLLPRRLSPRALLLAAGALGAATLVAGLKAVLVLAILAVCLLTVVGMSPELVEFPCYGS